MGSLKQHSIKLKDILTQEIQWSSKKVLRILTSVGCSIRSSFWLWWTTNKKRPAIENNPRSTQIQYENLLRTGRRYSAPRRRIFHRFLPQFNTKSRFHTDPYPRFDQNTTRQSFSAHIILIWLTWVRHKCLCSITIYTKTYPDKRDTKIWNWSYSLYY